MTFHLDAQADPDSLLADVRQGIREADPADVGKRDWEPVHLALKEDDGSVVGGLYGATMWKWLMIDGLWVSPEQRGLGLGKQLVLAAEETARERGGIESWLGTFDFQSRGFYAHLGYEAFSELQGFPPGHVHYHLRKKL